jgi:CYTH domain-containing protein
MTMLRQFIIAPSLARLIQRERGGERVLEGYFPDRPHQSIYVQVEENRSSLILVTDGEGGPEERTDLPHSHAQALLAVTQGQVGYVRTSLSLGSREIWLQHYFEPGTLYLISVAVEQDDQEFHPLPWFGPEVSAEPAYQRRRMALDGLPAVPEVELTNAALHSLLDVVENRLASWPLPHQAAAPEEPAASGPASPDPSELESWDDADQDDDDFAIEDDVIRDLARSLRPQRR